jgi:hypothetical protein
VSFVPQRAALFFAAAIESHEKKKAMAVCSTVLPVASADLCSPNVNFGQISQLYFTRLGDGLTLSTDDTEWAGRLDNASTGTTALPEAPDKADIRQLFGIDSLSAPERPEAEISRGRKAYSDPEFTLTFNVDDTGDINWNDFMLGLPISGQVYSVWFGTETRLFGGNSGIQATVVANPEIPESSSEIMRIVLTVTWKGDIPEVHDNPLS